MSTRHRVIITDFLDDDLQPERDVLGPDVETVALNAHAECDLAGHVEDADAIILYHTLSLSASTIERLVRCRLIVRGGVGVDNVDLEAARGRGIDVANVPDYGSEEVADTAVAMMLTLTRGVHLLNSRLQSDPGKWTHLHAAPLTRLRGQVCGIVGLGRIGTAVALRAKACGMRVLFHDPYKPDGYDKALGIERADSLDMLLARVLVVTLHCPLTEETHHLIDIEAIAKMRTGTYLVNTARGGIVDASAIPGAIKSGQLAGVALDVLEQEPPAAGDLLLRAWRNPHHPAHDRLIISAHAAFYSEEGALDIRVKTAQACRRVLDGLPPRNVVN